MKLSHKNHSSNKYNIIVRFILVLLILFSLSIFAYWIFVKINTLDILYYRIESYDYNEKVDFYRFEIESTIELIKDSINMVILCSFLLIMVCLYAFCRSKNHKS